RMHQQYTQWSDRDEARFREALDLAQTARKRVEAHDPLTQEHGVRVAQWAILLAGRLPGFDRRRIRKLEISALLHDYGKLMIPAEILNKPGKLTESEWALIRKHPEIGAMSAPVNDEFINRDAIMWHHKRFDGGGYPEGKMSGLEIPIEARITSVADVFDAVASARAYHKDGKGQGTRKAFEVLHQASGVALDPTLVSMFATIHGDTSREVGGQAGLNTMAVASVIAVEAAKARKYLQREIGHFDHNNPLGGSTPPPGLVEKLVNNLVRANLDRDSAQNVVRHVLRLPLPETFHSEDLAMNDSEVREAVRKAENHEEAVLYVKRKTSRFQYMSVVVFRGQLWLCVGDKAGDRIRISLVR
ncbi:MAG: HD domain-containing protein, partial [Deltaproteobacteria bacterium]|nr:HD domain-containing protein [Deltaproteobacteria bacterium]